MYVHTFAFFVGKFTFTIAEIINLIILIVIESVWVKIVITSSANLVAWRDIRKTAENISTKTFINRITCIELIDNSWKTWNTKWYWPAFFIFLNFSGAVPLLKWLKIKYFTFSVWAYNYNGKILHYFNPTALLCVHCMCTFSSLIEYFYLFIYFMRSKLNWHLISAKINIDV